MYHNFEQWLFVTSRNLMTRAYNFIVSGLCETSTNYLSQNYCFIITISMARSYEFRISGFCVLRRTFFLFDMLLCPGQVHIGIISWFIECWYCYRCLNILVWDVHWTLSVFKTFLILMLKASMVVSYRSYIIWLFHIEINIL